MARPSKPELTPEEWAAIEGIKSNIAAAAKVSDLRGANVLSISHAEALRRSVSKEFIRRARRELSWVRVLGSLPTHESQHKTSMAQNTQAVGATTMAQNNSPTGHSGSRMAQDQTVQESQEISERASEPATPPSQTKVESEQGAKA